jgi:DNA-binding LacI/PurR family transcriptional regulator
VTELLARDPLITAVFAENDMMAIGALGAVQHAGMRVPADITIIGFDDISFSESVTPGLTTVAQPVTEVATTAIRLLFERLADPGLPPERVVLPVSLVVRGSCGPAPDGHASSGHGRSPERGPAPVLRP